MKPNTYYVSHNLAISSRKILFQSQFCGVSILKFQGCHVNPGLIPPWVVSLGGSISIAKSCKMSLGLGGSVSIATSKYHFWIPLEDTLLFQWFQTFFIFHIFPSYDDSISIDYHNFSGCKTPSGSQLFKGPEDLLCRLLEQDLEQRVPGNAWECLGSVLIGPGSWLGHANNHYNGPLHSGAPHSFTAEIMDA